MKPYERVAEDFKVFLSKKGDNAFNCLKDFFEVQKEQFYTKISELRAQGLSVSDKIKGIESLLNDLRKLL